MERIVAFYNLILFLISLWLLWDPIFGWTIRKKKTLAVVTIILAIGGCFISYVSIGFMLALVFALFVFSYSLFLMKEAWWRKLVLSGSSIVLAGSVFGLWRNAISLLSNEKIGNRVAYLLAFLMMLLLGGVSKKIFKNIRWKMQLLPLIGMSMFFLFVNKYLIGYSYSILDSSDYSIRFDMALAELGIVVLFMLCVVFVGNIFAKLYYQQMVTIREEYLTVQGKYYESIEEKNKSVRSIRHDIKNHLIVIQTLLEDGRVEKAKEYLNEIAEKIEDTDTKIHTGNPIVDAIIMDKMMTAKKYDIEVLVEGMWSYEAMTSVDICTLLANMIDNAIEAIEKGVDEKKICLSFKRTEQFFSVSCVNDCLSDVVWKDGVIETSKKDKRNHGFGIGNIVDVCDKYVGNMDIQCNASDKNENENQFCITLIFPIQS
ncbi:MAG: GHKL domain-containing protein [Eubacteriales bacterium]|nr:GHKL domain-containing protein [Eubacteriales bacterium]